MDKMYWYCCYCLRVYILYPALMGIHWVIDRSKLKLVEQCLSNPSTKLEKTQGSEQSENSHISEIAFKFIWQTEQTETPQPPEKLCHFPNLHCIHFVGSGALGRAVRRPET